MGLRRFQIELPREWQDRTPYAFESPAFDGRATQVVLETVPAAGLTLADFAASRLARTRAALGTAELYSEGPIDLGEGRPAIRFVFRQLAEGTATYLDETIVAFQGRYFAFSASFDELTWAAHGPVVQQIVASLAAGPAAE